MITAINPVAIFLPVLVIVALTFFAILRLAGARGAAIKGGQDPASYRTHQGPPEPERAIVAVRHYGNLFELPVLFYAGCIAAFALGAVNSWMLLFAWGYVAARLAQSAVHLSYNNPMHRGMAFMVGTLFVMALWIGVAMEVIVQL